LILLVGLLNVALEEPDETPVAPDLCKSGAIENLLHQFADSVNNGTIGAEIDDYFSIDRFSWYSVQGAGGRSEDDSRDRSTLETYFVGRVAMEERIEIVSFDASHDAERGITHLRNLYLRRSAADIEGQLNVEGKGAIDCSSGKISALSIGDGDSSDLIMIHDIRALTLFVPSGILAYIFGTSGLSKLRNPLRASIAIARFGLRRRIRPASGRALGLLELLLAAGLVVVPMLPLVSSGALLLLLTFCALQIRALARGRSFDCGCFDRPDPITWMTLTRTALMATVALGAIVASSLYPPSSSLSAGHAIGVTMGLLGASMISLLSSTRAERLFSYSLTLDNAR
jgi:hypothetical protein